MLSGKSTHNSLPNIFADRDGATGLVTVQTLGGGNWQLLPCGKVGAVRAGDLDIQVKPKADIAQLLFLLCYAKDPGFWPEDDAGG